MDNNIVREKIREYVTQFIRGHEQRLVLRTFTGSGKTTTTLDTIDKAGLRWIYAAPTHDIIEENITDSRQRSYSFTHLRGRELSCLRQDMKALAKLGLDFSIFCSECEFKRIDKCPYDNMMLDVYRKLPNLAITHAHISNWLPEFLAKDYGEGTIGDHYDVIIIDENPVKCFLDEMVLSRGDLVFLRECLVLGELPVCMVELVELLLAYPLNYEELVANDTFALNRIVLNKSFTMAIVRLYTQGTISKIPKNIFNMMFNIMEIQNNDIIKQMIFQHENDLYLMFFRRNALNLNIRLIGLDGTASQLIWDTMLNAHVRLEFYDADYRNLYQLNGGRFPITTWRKSERTAIMLTSLIERIAKKRKRKVLVCGTKFVNKTIASRMPHGLCEYAVYYNLRSKNSFYKKCDTVILACEPNPPLEKIQSCIKLSGWSAEVWRLIFREEEMLQGIGRIRQNITEIDGVPREDTYIFILPSTGVNKVERVSKLIPQAQIININLFRSMVDNWVFAPEYDYYFKLFAKYIPGTLKDISKGTGIGYQKTKNFILVYNKEHLIQYGKGNRIELTESGILKTGDEEKIGRLRRESNVHIES